MSNDYFESKLIGKYVVHNLTRDRWKIVAVWIDGDVCSKFIRVLVVSNDGDQIHVKLPSSDWKLV